MREKRIKLDIGAITASSIDGGSFMFFLYKNGMEKCLAVPLAPQEIHSVLVNFKQIQEDTFPIQNIFAQVLREYRIELLEVNVIRPHESKNYETELKLFDGEKEIVTKTAFADGMIMAKLFGCPIYATQEFMDKYATENETFRKEILNAESLQKKLKDQLEDAVKSEDYEEAERISKKIIFLQKNSQKTTN